MSGKFLDAELNFTDTYKQYKDAPAPIREVMCLKTMFESYFSDIREGDLFAGRVKYPLLGFGLENTTGGSLYFCKTGAIKDLLRNSGQDEDYRAQVLDMLAFWEEEVFLEHGANENNPESKSKLIKRLPPDVLAATSNCIGSMGGRLAGTDIDFEKLVKTGVPGLVEEVEGYRAAALSEGRNTDMYDAMLLALETFVEILRRYSTQARQLADTAQNDNRSELIELAAILDKLTISRPETLREGIQLVLLYSLAAQTVNFGRMDVYLGDLYVKDIEAGILDEARALELLQSLWNFIIARRKSAHEPGDFNGRIIIGGKGRSNEENADRFALLAMEASRTVVETEPQLTLRVYKGMNPALMKKALDVIGEGRVYPMLYNDDVNVPAAAKAFGVSMKEAEQYLPYGCGEYNLDHIAVGSPNCSLNLLKALEVTLHNGKDAFTGKPAGLETGGISSFDTFDKLLAAYEKQVEFHVENLAKRHAVEYEVENEIAGFVYVSMLYDHCIERGKSLTAGGARYRGGVIESFGMVNTADSLTAIKELVYDRKLLTLEQLVQILDADYNGYEKEHKLILDVPKFGNDNEAADRMVQLISSHVCTATIRQAPRVGFDYFLVVNINNYANVEFGKTASASADGRHKGSPLANGNTPTAGMDKSGITAFLNSLAKIDASEHAGYSHNMKFSKQLFNNERKKLEVLLDTYFARGGTQAMITVVNKGDLENALREPQRYSNLIVRVGGFSARFVELAKEIQQDILNRTLY